MARKNNNILKVSLAIVLLIAIAASISFLFGIGQIAYDPAMCSLNSCPSGYTPVEDICSGTTCTRTCEKIEAAHCSDSYTTINNKITTYGVDENDLDRFSRTSGGSFVSPKIYLSNSKCYKLIAGASFSVANRDPGGILHFDSESNSVTAAYSSGEKTSCGTQTTVTATTNPVDIGRGTNSYSSAAIGKYNAFTDTSCGSQSYGSRGELKVSLGGQESDWIPEQIDIVTNTCNFECSSSSNCKAPATGEQYCDGDTLKQEVFQESCVSYSCQAETTFNIVAQCDYGCSNGACVTPSGTDTSTDTSTDTTSNTDTSSDSGSGTNGGADASSGTDTSGGSDESESDASAQSSITDDNADLIKTIVWVVVGLTSLAIVILLIRKFKK